jgi:DNA helicase HerA-like ATPase
MQDYEKLGVFYLGRHYDLQARKSLPELALYESKHLVTHGLVVGMTGSGKTGLCFDIIEEAVMDGIPSIVIDPKGDLGNLLLTFPELRGEDFAPWVNEDDARRAGLSTADFSAQQADLWRTGLEKWAQDGERIRRLRAAADFALYTPGSSAGLQISILKSFAVPSPEILEDGELLRERVASSVTGLLGLVGITADPVKSRESVLLSNLILNAWRQGRDLDLAGLIQELQNPSVQRIGVLDLETFYPAKERFELAIQLNNVLASPGFAAWMEGEPLDVGHLLFTETGRPRVAIFSLAHLGDSERMFFVTLLLNQVLSWMRSQSGTSSLRAMVYMDEIAGYFPPVANPPAKQPLLTLLKQGRAYGVGVLLATQNPVDLDYKGLANIGSWFIGRLQTERDKARVLEGLEGAAVGRGLSFDRNAAAQVLAGLGSRVFLLHNVHQDAPEIFESRWTMSYLRGPLSRSQIKSLVGFSRTASSPREALPQPSVSGFIPSAVKSGSSGSSSRPVLPPQVPQFFAPVCPNLKPGTPLQYFPRLLAGAQVRFVDSTLGVNQIQNLLAAVEITDEAIAVDWATAEELAISASELEKEPMAADYAACPSAASQSKNYAAWGKDFITWILNHQSIQLLRSEALGLVSKPGEGEREFRIRLQQVAREMRDDSAEKLRAKYAPKTAMLQDRLRRAEAAREREAAQAQRAKLDTVISFGTTLLGAFLGRKTLSSSTVGKAATTIRSANRAFGQAGDVDRAGETVELLRQQLQELEAQFQAEVSALAVAKDPMTAKLETVELNAKRPNINLQLVALAWLPFRCGLAGELVPAYRLAQTPPG